MPEANESEFHSSGIIDMLEKLQKKFNALRLFSIQSQKKRTLLEKKITPQGSETILKDLDNITEYNTMQLVDNTNKNKVLKQILIKEKVNTKAYLQRHINALRLSPIPSQKKRTLLEKKFTPHGSETTSLHQLDEFNDLSMENLVEKEKNNIIELDETSLKDFNVQEFNVKDFNVRTNEKQNDLESYTFNVKECNAMLIETNKKFYIIFAQFKQQQFEESQTVYDTDSWRFWWSEACSTLPAQKHLDHRHDAVRESRRLCELEVFWTIQSKSKC